MKKINLTAMSAAELTQLKNEIDKELAGRSKKLQAIEEVKKLAAAKGLRLDEIVAELGGAKATRVKRELGPAPIKFRHPKDHSLTWSGRGKRPNWMKEALAKGIKEEAMRL